VWPGAGAPQPARLGDGHPRAGATLGRTRARRLPTRPGDCPLPQRRTERLGPIAHSVGQPVVAVGQASWRICAHWPSAGCVGTMPEPRRHDDGFSRHQTPVGRTSALGRRLPLAIPMNERLLVAVGAPQPPFRSRPIQAIGGTSTSFAGGAEANRRPPTRLGLRRGSGCHLDRAQ
jgi:hypothetical protein